MTDRRQARIIVMQILCQLDVMADAFMPQLDEFVAEETSDPVVRQYAQDLARRAWNERETLDKAIQEVAEHWDLGRMAPVDRNIIRAALCELRYRPDVPHHVVINEAIEIGKAFGTAESPAFINGILDAIRKKMKSEGRNMKDEG